MSQAELPERINQELTPEQESLLVGQVRDTYASQLRAAAISEEAGLSAERSLHYALNQLSYRADRDPELAGLVSSLLNELSQISSFGASDGPLPEEKRKDIRAVLIGATMALQTRRDEQKMPDRQPKEHVDDASRFIDLVEKRVGSFDSDGSQKLHMNVGDKQASREITIRKAE